MTEVSFLTDNNVLSGFKITGHSSEDCDDELGKIVCASVSSAAYMAANTITDVIKDKADIRIGNADFYLKVNNPSITTISVLKGLKIHLQQLSGQYSNKIKIYGGAKHVKD